MESGLKKLWTRRKSKGTDGRQDGIGILRKSQSTEQALRSVATSSPSNHTRIASTDAQYKSSGSNRVPSALAGAAARPSTSWSRPGTDGSGSLMNAVNLAADAVARADQEYHYPADRYPKEQVRPKTPRYVDIFSLSSSNSPNPRPGYNEDVAERNLDLARVALEGTHQYVPSKFQEEVAARNAFPSLPGSGSVDSSPSVRQNGFHGSQSTGPTRGISSPVSSYPQSPQKFGERPFSRRTQNVNSSIGSHSRQQSNRSWDSQGQLHELPASRHSIEDPRQTQTLASPTTTLASSSHEPISSHPGGGPADFHPPVFPNGALSNYQLSASEVTQVKPNESYQMHRPGVVTSPDHSTDSQAYTHSVRSPSNLSNASSVKRTITLPNRTIMDLTGNDSEVFSEGYPPSNYSSSPILEHAKVDTARKVQGAAISGPTTEDAKTDISPAQIKTHSPIGIEQAAAVPTPPSHQPQLEPPSELPRSEDPPRPHFAISFSPITTIASASPRASVVLEAPITSDQTGQTQISPGLAELQDQQNDTRDALRAKQVVQQDEHSLNHPSGFNVNEVEEQALQSGKEIGDGAIPVGQTGKAVEPVVQESPATAPFEPDHDLDTSPPRRPYIHMASDGLSSTGLGDPVRPSSVSTREFASTPGRSMLTSVPEEVEVKSNGHAKPPGELVTETMPKGSSLYIDSEIPQERLHNAFGYQSTFDEREYAQKQAEARAALIRLQHSLNEAFLTQPTPAPDSASTRSSPSKHAYSFSDGKPAAPSSIFSQVRHSLTPTDAMGEADRRLEGGRLETSYHHLTTVPHEKEGGKARRKRSTRSAAKSEALHRKGKQRVESELNGPGPSIINDLESPKRPLHLPPPLHLNGHPIHHLLQHQPPSPGEISLSNFPIPVSSPRQSVIRPPVTEDAETQQAPTPTQQHAYPHQDPTSAAEMKERILRRQASQRSQASGNSAFSIPYHMIPDRSSSRRDRSVMETDE
ncbi:uncharacterized protein Z520_02788 [Fonsecaea multimorphosa CBS 102226]|uniref:Uncharacterized protein n=1 Tax=Fonsecaea multimorphosa CBS 102226 TaxID=1442371 RepID=A0A0D2HH29_9EURO|nr:uncharacterized protein Z520_02788 [Fonsecaea multimorphosa CBS 102226]KIY01236.1 hypothetical protein Z520_02788 [Fonsecaea multimorphosa CBS 102226]OAL28516.1 hypothetical protein AYO22_02710 [Fonsecaea multimorphosa]